MRLLERERVKVRFIESWKKIIKSTYQTVLPNTERHRIVNWTLSLSVDFRQYQKRYAKQKKFFPATITWTNNIKLTTDKYERIINLCQHHNHSTRTKRTTTFSLPPYSPGFILNMGSNLLLLFNALKKIV